MYLTTFELQVQPPCQYRNINFLYSLFTVVAEDNHGMLFNGSNVSSTHEVTKVQFSGLDWEYGRPQNGPEYLMASGTSTEDVTVAVSVYVSTGDTV